MAKILFHCGAHKTASSHIKYNLELNKKYLESKGVVYFKTQRDGKLRKKAIELRKSINDDNYNVDEAIHYIRAKINEEINGYNFVIFSYEGVFGDLSLFRSKAIYPRAEKLIKIYEQIFKYHDVYPVYVIRDYIDFILSTYKYSVKNGLALKMSEYLEDFHLDVQRWTKIIKALEQTFEKRPFVWTYETYKKEPCRILCSFLTALLELDINCSELEIDQGKKNKSAGKSIVNIHYALNKYIYHDIKLLNRPLYRIINKRISKYAEHNQIFFKNLLPDCFDVDLHSKFDSESEYKDEVKTLKKSFLLN
jgi:hypothetical protein